MKSMLHKLSYSAYCSPNKVVEFTGDELMARPILFYERIAKFLHLRPYFLGILLISLFPTSSLLQRWENPEVWEISVSIVTLEKIVLFNVVWIFSALIFFYALTFIKDAYFQTLRTLRSLISPSKYEELKGSLCRKEVTYITLGLMSCGLILGWSYDFYLGYKLGFWSENLPIWCAFRYGPITYFSGGAGLILWLFLYSDVINEVFSWFYLPFAIQSSVKETAQKDPDIFSDAQAFNELNKSILRITLLLLTSSVLAGSLCFILPVAPVFRMSLVILLLIFIPFLFACRLRNSAIKKSIYELQKDMEQREKKGDKIGVAQTAARLAELQKFAGETDQSYQNILKAADNYEKAVEHETAAENYSLAGKHREAADAYKKQTKKEEDKYSAKYYAACSYSELAEELMRKHKIDEAYERLDLAFNIFEQVESAAKDEFLKHSSGYRKWECEGRLHVMNALKGYGSQHDIRTHRMNINIKNTFREFDRAIKLFERAEQKCERLGDDPLLQLYIHRTWCEIYKRLVYMEHAEFALGSPGKNDVELKGFDIRPIPLVNLKFGKRKDEERVRLHLLDASLRDLAKMKKELVKSNRKKVKDQVDMAFYALHALKELKFNNDEIKASDFVIKAIKIARRLEIWQTDGSGILNDQIDNLLENIFYVNFQFSAPQCPVVNINAYKKYVKIIYDGMKEIGAQKNLRFKIYYDPPRDATPFEDAITVMLLVSFDDKKDERKLQIEARKEVIESFPAKYPCDLMKAKLSYKASSDCWRQLRTKEIFCDELELGKMMR